MTGTETISGSQEMTSSPRGSTPHALQALPVELLVEIMKYLPDMAALSRLFTAFPKTLIQFNDQTAKDIFVSIVNNMSPELREAALDVLAVRSRPPIRPSEITRFIKRDLDAEVCYTPSRLRQHSLSALLDIITVSESIERLSESFARDRVLAPCMQFNMPISPVELHRIRRSFWRFQLCYDMCHPEGADPSGESRNVRRRRCRRLVRHQNPPPISPSVPGWAQCRGEGYRPEALSRFLPNLSCWEQEELEAIRFHLVHEVRRLQHHRSLEPIDYLLSQPLLLQRLIRDFDRRHPPSPTDHVLVAALTVTQHARSYPATWTRIRRLYAASTPNTARRFAIRALQRGRPQWGWCVWDERRLVRRGLLDPEFETWVRRDSTSGVDETAQAARIAARWTAIGRAHAECAEAAGIRSWSPTRPEEG